MITDKEEKTLQLLEIAGMQCIRANKSLYGSQTLYAEEAMRLIALAHSSIKECMSWIREEEYTC